MKQSPELPVRFYLTEAGGTPVLDWLRSLDKEDRRVIGLDLMRVQFGFGDGLREVRSSLPSQRIARVILCFHAQTLVVLHGFIRKTQNEGGYQMRKRNNHICSSLNDFLKEEGVLEETRAVAMKETLAWQVQQAMEKDKISQVEMARRMNTSRAALDRLLDPRNASVTLQTWRGRHTPSAGTSASNWVGRFRAILGKEKPRCQSFTVNGPPARKFRIASIAFAYDTRAILS